VRAQGNPLAEKVFIPNAEGRRLDEDDEDVCEFENVLSAFLFLYFRFLPIKSLYNKRRCGVLVSAVRVV
jgi:hypothetical protein